LFNLGPLGDFYLVNSLPSLLVVDLILIGLAFAVRQSLRKGDLVPPRISGAMEMVVEMLYNLTESSAGNGQRKFSHGSRLSFWWFWLRT
jgi:F-type H+-transporting ATPase subunit a